MKFALYMQDGKTPLMYACLKGNDRIVQLLIEYGANPEAMDSVCNVSSIIIHNIYMGRQRVALWRSDWHLFELLQCLILCCRHFTMHDGLQYDHP